MAEYRARGKKWKVRNYMQHIQSDTHGHYCHYSIMVSIWTDFILFKFNTHNNLLSFIEKETEAQGCIARKWCSHIPTQVPLNLGAIFQLYLIQSPCSSNWIKRKLLISYRHFYTGIFMISYLWFSGVIHLLLTFCLLPQSQLYPHPVKLCTSN